MRVLCPGLFSRGWWLVDKEEVEGKRTDFVQLGDEAEE